jgi:glycosyltransferase involved in cell wall biosynthesis
MKTLSLVIPAYNEEDGIAQIIERALPVGNALQEQGLNLELIVVDDGSRDHTARIASGYPGVRVIKHPMNRGYGAAIKTGFRCASGEWLAFIDADGTYPPESLPEMCRAAVERDADLVIGSRMSGAHSDMPITRRVGNVAYALLLSLIGNRVVRDTTSGMRVLRRDALAQLYPLSDGLDFTPAMSTRAIHENLKTVEVLIPYAERVGRSKLSVVRDGVRFTNTIVWTALTYNPVRILGFVSLALLAIALAVASYIVSLRASGVTMLTAWQVYALASAAVLGFAGISLFSLGAMFNYLVALFDRQPVRRGLFGKPIFDPPLDRHFGWVGIISTVAGILLSLFALALGLNGWEITRLWFYLLASALLSIVGIQLSVAWLVMRVLEQLAQRETAARRDLETPREEGIRGTDGS